MNRSFVYTENMTVGYDGKALIRDIRLSLEKGQILTLIGPNGAGKSTILKSIIRQLKLVDGAVFLDQKSMEKMSDKEISRKLAVVMTGRMQPELMTCEDIVGTGRYPYTGVLGILSAEDHEKVRSAMELVHAWDLKDRDFSAVSDGQRQRILSGQSHLSGTGGHRSGRADFFPGYPPQAGTSLYFKGDGPGKTYGGAHVFA